MDSVRKRFAKLIRPLLGKSQPGQTTHKEPLPVSALPPFAEMSGGLDSLPDNSARFLSPGPLETIELLTGREAQLSQPDDALSHCQDGHPAGIALVGP